MCSRETHQLLLTCLRSCQCPLALSLWHCSRSLGCKESDQQVDAFASAEPRFSFFGNVNVGRDVSVAQLREQYDAVVLAYGAEQPKKLDTVLASLEKSTISQVHLVARRGPYQTAFTAKELREMTKLPGTSLPQLQSSQLPLCQFGIRRVLRPWPKTPHANSSLVERDPSAKTKHLEAVRFQRMDPVASASPLGSKVTTNPMEYVDIPCGLLITSLGYTGNPITTSTSEVPFDSSKGLIPNTRGRVLDVSHKVVPGLYASGWIKRGAVGVIAATMYDAIETAESVLQDVGSTKPASSKSGFNGIATLEGKRAEGVKRGKEREKVVDLRIVDQVLKNQR
ncbi:hypothetical protein BCR33DRAFT_849123 [Rhizoclosmatium globosum]|uniref:FAD/NAD(P)-binding domain-containing protein n=1 Tax=Rhizoclosmatium globosum TaxID=329046 RepID=A0A1Y2CHU0_9FUNG|nr:hypothetical protein BCR33DRAFT_849123 [Rhizoclosmatium globosum]|eukprot:ORY46394.1 hypothetical protein BCR33DRAFT_849123 [Rhizoclosmatium globosum]